MLKMKTLKPHPIKSQQQGFALVSVLLVLVVLTVAITAFLANMRIERIAARNIVNLAQAQTASDAAFTDFSQKLRYYFEQYPDSATTWQTIQNHDFTAFYYRDGKPQEAGAPDFIYPLVSGAQVKAYAEKGDTLPAFTATNSVDLNADNWIGTLPGENRKEFRAPWVEQYDAKGKVISRYAFWAEDESFKVNVNIATNVGRGSTSLGRSASEIPLQGVFEQVGNPDSLADSIVNGRKAIPGSKFFTINQINHVASQGEEPKLSESVKFLATAFSSALNMSRNGSKRLNLNEVVKDSSNGSEIRRQLDQIIGAISYHLPDFGQRFYRKGNDLNSLDVDKSQGHPDIYLQRLAANIRDYIDTDSQPTIIGNKDNSNPQNQNLTFGKQDIWIGALPIEAIGPNLSAGQNLLNQTIAIGQENIPRLQEAVMHVKQVSPTKDDKGKDMVDYNIEIDYYFEFWNMSTKDIKLSDLGNNVYISVANQMGWSGGSLGEEPEDLEAERELIIPLSTLPNLVFKAGDITVITTDPDPDILQKQGGTVDDSKLFTATPQGKRVFTGQVSYKPPGNFGGYPTLRLVTRGEGPTSPFPAKGFDAYTEIFLANSRGYLDSAQGALVVSPSVYVDANTSNPKNDPKICHWRGSILAGNNTFFNSSLQVGDPRALNAQLAFQNVDEADQPQETRFKVTNAKNQKSAVPDSTISLANDNQVNFLTWKDPFKQAISAAASAPAVIANSALFSIGELGNIYDQSLGNQGNQVTAARGGGLTLKIGQSDQFKSGQNEGGHWDGKHASASYNWAAWRLTDVFTITNSLETQGLININGILRDNGASLKSALYNYQFLSQLETDPSLAGKNLNEKAIQKFLDEAKIKLTQNDALPFLERGEFSEFSLFNQGSDLGANMQTANDRGREELFRRLVELVTAKGNIFSIYIVGQSLRETPSGNKQVLGTTKRKITFKLTPIYNSSLNNNFNGSSNSDLNQRFRKPDNYEIQVLNITSN